MQLRTALGRSDELGTDRAVCLHLRLALPSVREEIRCRIVDDGPANSRSLVLEFHCGKHVRSKRLLRIFDLDRDIKQRREALTYEQLAQLTTDEDGDRNHLSSETFQREMRRPGLAGHIRSLKRA